MINEHKIEHVLEAIYNALKTHKLEKKYASEIMQEVNDSLKLWKKVELLEQLRKEKTIDRYSNFTESYSQIIDDIGDFTNIETRR